MYSIRVITILEVSSQRHQEPLNKNIKENKIHKKPPALSIKKT